MSPLATSLSATLPIHLPPTIWPEAPDRVTGILPGVRWIDDLAFMGTARVEGGTRFYTFRSQPGFIARSQRVVPVSTLEDVLARHPFLEVDLRDTKKLRVHRGEWAVSTWLVLPTAYGLAKRTATTVPLAQIEGHREAQVEPAINAAHEQLCPTHPGQIRAEVALPDESIVLRATLHSISWRSTVTPRGGGEPLR